MAQQKVDVYLEVAPKRSFAVAVDWPGWARSGRDEASALATLVDYAPRYARVVGRTADLRQPASVEDLKVVERLRGGSGTEFGVPGHVPKLDERQIDADELGRQVRLLRAAWKAFDRTVDAAADVTLRTGPRGGGRQLPKIVEHCVEAEVAYLTKLGAKFRSRGRDDPAGLIEPLRELIVQALEARVRGTEMPSPAATRTLWPPRYFVRRTAWHILDHAWEIEDRATA